MPKRVSYWVRRQLLNLWKSISAEQIASAIKELVSQAGGADKPHIICGDFNSIPSSAGYQLARDGYLSDDNVT